MHLHNNRMQCLLTRTLPLQTLADLAAGVGSMRQLRFDGPELLSG